MTSNSREEIGLASQADWTAEQGQGGGERSGLEALVNKASQNVSGARRVAAPVLRTGQCRHGRKRNTTRDGTPGPMNEKSTANCRKKSIPSLRETGNNPNAECSR